MVQHADVTPYQEVLAPFALAGPSGLLPALLEVQRRYGFISEERGAAIAAALAVPLADVHGVIDFYALLYSKPVGRTVVRVCTDPSCALRGGEAVLQSACRLAAVDEGGTSVDGAVTVGKVMTICATFDHRFIDGVHAAVLSRIVHTWLGDPFKYFDPLD